MKNVYFSFLFVSFLITPFVFADLPIVAEPSVLDFGQVNESTETLELSLKLRNSTDRTVKITNTRTNCGCTIAEPKQPTISAQGNIDIKVNINIAGYKGKFDKNIYFDIDGKEEPLTVSVFVPESTKIGQIKGCVHFADSVGNRGTIDVIAIVIPKR